MDPQESQRRQTYLGLGTGDGDNVRVLREVFHQHASHFADRFYDHLRTSSETAPFIQDPATLERLKHLQAEYFAQLLEGVFDENYIQKRLSVGRTHQRVGIEPVLYLGAYNQYIQLTFPLFIEAFGNNLSVVLPSLLSLVKVIFFDITLALDTYFRAATEQMRSRNAELQQALTLVQRTHQREEQLRHLLSHEIRGGLAAIISSLEEVRDIAPLEGEAQGELSNALDRAWSMSQILATMLSQPRPGEPTRIDTTDLLQGLRPRFRFYATGREAELHLPDSAPPVWGDAGQLREVFANLLANAVRYLDKIPGRVEVIARPFQAADAPADLEHPAGAFVLFGVRDNGPGLPNDVCQRRFEPFAREADSPVSPRAGTGLGLYFVRTLVEQGGGRVWYETHSGEGTCFWFTVPGAPAEPPGNGSPVQSGDRHG